MVEINEENVIGWESIYCMINYVSIFEKLIKSTLTSNSLKNNIEQFVDKFKNEMINDNKFYIEKMSLNNNDSNDKNTLNIMNMFTNKYFYTSLVLSEECFLFQINMKYLSIKILKGILNSIIVESITKDILYSIKSSNYFNKKFSIQYYDERLMNRVLINMQNENALQSYHDNKFIKNEFNYSKLNNNLNKNNTIRFKVLRSKQSNVNLNSNTNINFNRNKSAPQVIKSRNTSYIVRYASYNKYLNKNHWYYKFIDIDLSKSKSEENDGKLVSLKRKNKSDIKINKTIALMKLKSCYVKTKTLNCGIKKIKHSSLNFNGCNISSKVNNNYNLSCSIEKNNLKSVSSSKPQNDSLYGYENGYRNGYESFNKSHNKNFNDSNNKSTNITNLKTIQLSKINDDKIINKVISKSKNLVIKNNKISFVSNDEYLMINSGDFNLPLITTLN